MECNAGPVQFFARGVTIAPEVGVLADKTSTRRGPSSTEIALFVRVANDDG